MDGKPEESKLKGYTGLHFYLSVHFGLQALKQSCDAPCRVKRFFLRDHREVMRTMRKRIRNYHRKSQMMRYHLEKSTRIDCTLSPHQYIHLLSKPTCPCIHHRATCKSHPLIAKRNLERPVNIQSKKIKYM